MERRGSANLGIEERLGCVRILRVPYVASSRVRSTSPFSPRKRIGGGSEQGFTHPRLHQSTRLLSSSAVDLPANGFEFLRSDRYSRNDCTSNWKAMLLNKVVVGKGYKMTVDNTTLTQPPAGYDSVSTAA